MLLSEFKKVLIIDDFDDSEIPINELARVNKYTNPTFWIKSRRIKSLKVVRRIERDFKHLIKKHSLDKTKIKLTEKLEEKFNYLLNTSNPDGYIYQKVA